MFNLLITESKDFSSVALEVLRNDTSAHLCDLDRNAMLKLVSKADILWVRLRHQIDKEVLDAAPRLRYIVSPTTGLTHIDVDEAEKRGIEVLSLQGEQEFLQDIRATAEHTIALVLSVMRHIPSASTHVINGGWNRDLFKGSELYKKTAGVIGYGRLGRIVAQYLKGFGMDVLTTDPVMSGSHVDGGITLVSMGDLLRRSDVISLHVNYTKANMRFFGRQEFLQMKQSAFFINTSRGELVDEHALLEALQNGIIRGAALDVLDSETSSGMLHHPLVEYARHHENLIITPHIGGCTTESVEKTEIHMAKKLLASLDAVRCEAPINSGTI